MVICQYRDGPGKSCTSWATEPFEMEVMIAVKYYSFLFSSKYLT